MCDSTACRRPPPHRLPRAGASLPSWQRSVLACRSCAGAAFAPPVSGPSTPTHRSMRSPRVRWPTWVTHRPRQSTPNGIPVRITAAGHGAAGGTFVGILGALPAVISRPPFWSPSKVLALHSPHGPCGWDGRTGSRRRRRHFRASDSATQSLGPENLAFPAFALIAIGARQTGRRGALGTLGCSVPRFRLHARRFRPA